jgi:predicted metal-binding membrane protein
MALDNRFAQGAVLVAAGVYQLSPLKSACLSQCRSPAQFISRHWRPGTGGAVRLGLLHGAYCVGCCWLLMALLFVGGVMNFAWIAALTLIVGIEKLAPRGDWIGRAAGLAILVWGAILIFG